MNQIPEKIKEYFDYSFHDTVELVTIANVRALLLLFTSFCVSIGFLIKQPTSNVGKSSLSLS
jgi:hypothetical protein